jgi:hypothetical protein
MSQINIKFWYPEVVEDLDKIVNAIEYYRAIHRDGQKYLDLRGYLGNLLEQQAGLLRIYGDALTDCTMIWKWLDETIKHEKAKKKLWYLSSEGKNEYGNLKKTEIDTILSADTNIKALVDLQLTLELWKMSLDKLNEQLKNRGIILGSISKIRAAGEHEAFIDATKETNPETLS